MKVVDINILLYATNQSDPNHQRALAWCAENFNGNKLIGLAWITIVAFLRLSTRKSVFQSPLTPEQALDRLNQWLGRPNVQIINESRDHWTILQDLIREAGTAGNLTTDAHLAALAISRGATLVSCDTDFARFRHLRWENPLTQS
jgi:toxin-antitoxin system PIN domain toxin